MADKPQESTALEALPEIVLIGKHDLFTTSAIIAAHADVQHESIVRHIASNREDFESFGPMGFSDFKSGNLGGRPKRVYKLNEQQATFLFTLLDNSAIVRRFKRELVRQFFAMREKLRLLDATRKECHALTDAILLTNGDPHPHGYTNEMNLIYKVALGMTASQYRKAHGLGSDENIRPHLSVEEIAAVQVIQGINTGLIWGGLLYADRRAKLHEAMAKIKAAKEFKQVRDMAE